MPSPPEGDQRNIPPADCQNPRHYSVGQRGQGVARPQRSQVYLSVFPSGKAQEVIQAAKEQMKTIRYELGQKVRYQLRKVPELAFYLDDSLDYLENIDRLLK